MITVYYDGKPYQYADSTKYLELARTLQPQFEHDIVLASVNGKLQELWKYMKDGANVSFLTTQSQAGIMAYRRSVVLLLLKALNDTISNRFSLPWRHCVKLIIQLRNTALVLKQL